MDILMKLKNKMYVSKKERMPLAKEILNYSDTQIFQGWHNQFIAYNRNKIIFMIYERTNTNEFGKLDIYFNDFAEQQIEECLELWEVFAGDKDIDKFITAHFHTTITMKKGE